MNIYKILVRRKENGIVTFTECERELAPSKKEALLNHLKKIKRVLDNNDTSSLSFKKYASIYPSITYGDSTEEKLKSISNRQVVIVSDELLPMSKFYESIHNKFINDLKKPNPNEKLTTRESLKNAFIQFGEDKKAIEKLRTKIKKPTAKKKVVSKKVVAKKK